ncbi:MAG: hypothetical protein AB7S36_16175 [Planctomycetota bacterium]
MPHAAARHRLLVLATLLALLAGCGHAAGDRAAVIDDVVPLPMVEQTFELIDPDGKPVEGVRIEVRWFDGKRSGETDATGRLTLSVPRRNCIVETFRPRGCRVLDGVM